jgi:hypothetical protein
MRYSNWLKRVNIPGTFGHEQLSEKHEMSPDVSGRITRLRRAGICFMRFTI